MRDAITPIPLPPGPPPAALLLFGGTFDPPHIAHTNLAEQARENVQRQSKGRCVLVLTPAARSPHKPGRPGASDRQRLAMLALATADCPETIIWTDELDRAEPAEPSFTVDTLARARRWMDDHGAASATLHLLIGADQAAEFHRWREPRRIIDLAEPVVLPRGQGHSAAALLETMRRAGFWSEAELARWKARVLDLPEVPVSSTGIRAGVAGGTGAAADLHPGVARYIADNGLYK